MSVDTGALRTFLEPIGAFLKEDGLTELCINRPYEVWCEGRNGWSRHELKDEKLGFSGLMGLARLAASFTKQDINEEWPVLSTTLPDRERCQIVIPPAVPEGTVSVTIRKPSDVKFSLSDFDELGFFKNVAPDTGQISDVDKELVNLRKRGSWLRFFDLAVKTRKNIIISGATGSGKTTFSKSLIECIPSHERIITIEDTLELDVPLPNHVRLLYSKDGQSLSKAGPKQLLESCLRMRPDRILLQELRDGAAFFYLRNANSGHPGSITTVHAESPMLAFEQLTLLVKESEGGSQIDRADIRALLLMLVDIVVQVKKFPDGRRQVTEVHFDPEKQLAQGI
ncbi:P-type DNA transfer ATPase VirB11 [Phyllobacterium brassicacearum]|uniref:Type IV secretion system protein n=1 Tax=Phyllobacterium brassicacearum TaxID=314235 RepID=A0A2P7BUJ5_9HYPH|nr:P-type DNA transfer ATPase VirB11 [Phyllobacterium brassicacearum]PSH70137.1 P-type DNA transfer ATPase VirB11 [Phyllobacterium brassicacearum]TDQ33993.1 type IV secretion system protein VirB11 [Phyllobacterium brassicacearum]